MCLICGEKRATHNHIEAKHGLVYCDYKNKYNNNHKVVSIEFDGYADVYNFEVDFYHNYTISPGIFVHNCHPRDNLVLSHLSDKLNLGYNIFEFVMNTREKQTEWIADLACSYGLPIVILGRTFKPNTNLTDGSPSILLANILKERGVIVTFYDPVTDPELPLNEPSVYIIGTTWSEFSKFDFAPESVVIDPWRMIKKVPSDVELVSIGGNSA